VQLFVGIGNPGPAYAHNRHNIGFMALDALASRYNFGPWKSKFSGIIAEGAIDGTKILLLKPQTYVNQSGRSVGQAVQFYKLALQDICVFYDELDLAPGKVKMKTGGGSAGHNGIRSLDSHIGKEYRRVRLGIGHPGQKELVSGYVLHDFAKADLLWLDPLLEALAHEAGWLAKQDDTRFLTALAHRLHQDKE
jgi:peptidyl-tRNA hydrolase, PTH1 family